MSEIQFVNYAQHNAVIHDIRLRVFTEEQGVDPALDFDGQDDDAIQVIALHENKPVGTGRMLQDGHIGRIAVLQNYRELGLGASIVNALITKAREEGHTRVFLGAQVTALPFYEKLGFSRDGDDYMEANILHAPMAMTLSNE